MIATRAGRCKALIVEEYGERVVRARPVGRGSATGLVRALNTESESKLVHHMPDEPAEVVWLRTDHRRVVVAADCIDIRVRFARGAAPWL